MIIDSDTRADEVLSTPCPELVQGIPTLRDGLLVLGAGGKMGPTLCMLARRAADEAGIPLRIAAVSRFADAAVRAKIDSMNIETISADLLGDGTLAALPDLPNVVFMAGRKFGSAEDEPLTWGMNVELPALVMRRFRHARVVAFSTGNVYPFTHTALLGSKETDATGPVGEYAWSCLGRERVIAHESARTGTPVAILRVNYAIDVRYGVLLDIAQRVRNREPIDLTMGHVNVIWQGDANTAALLAFAHCAAPPFVLNVTGTDTLLVRHLAQFFGDMFEVEPGFTGTPAETALLSDARRFGELMPFRRTGIDSMLRWIAHWVEIGGPTLGKPTKYEVRDGAF